MRFSNGVTRRHDSQMYLTRCTLYQTTCIPLTYLGWVYRRYTRVQYVSFLDFDRLRRGELSGDTTILYRCHDRNSTARLIDRSNRPTDFDCQKNCIRGGGWGLKKRIRRKSIGGTRVHRDSYEDIYIYIIRFLKKD